MQKDAQKFLGLAVADIERVSFVMPSSTRGEPVVVVRTRKAYDQDAVVKKTLGPNAVPIKLGDRAGFTQKERNGMSLCALDDRSFALGRDRGMKEAMKRADAKVTERPHGLAIEWAAANHQVVIGSTAEPLLYLIASEDKSAESAPAEVRPVPIEKNRVGPKRPEGKQVDPIEPKPDRVKDKPSRRGFAVQVEEKPIAPPQERIEERRSSWISTRYWPNYPSKRCRSSRCSRRRASPSPLTWARSRRRVGGSRSPMPRRPPTAKLRHGLCFMWCANCLAAFPVRRTCRRTRCGRFCPQSRASRPRSNPPRSSGMERWSRAVSC